MYICAGRVCCRKFVRRTQPDGQFTRVNRESMKESVYTWTGYASSHHCDCSYVIIAILPNTTLQVWCFAIKRLSKSKKTYNSGYSLVVTHLTTNPPVRCLNRAERTGSLVFNVLWSYVRNMCNIKNNIGRKFEARWGLSSIISKLRKGITNSKALRLLLFLSFLCARKGVCLPFAVA